MVYLKVLTGYLLEYLQGNYRVHITVCTCVIKGFIQGTHRVIYRVLVLITCNIQRHS